MSATQSPASPPIDSCVWHYAIETKSLESMGGEAGLCVADMGG